MKTGQRMQLRLNSCSCWRTLQQSVKPVSSRAHLFLFVFLLVLALRARAQDAPPQPPQQSQSAKPRGGASATSLQNADPQLLFQQGETALTKGDLDQAERSFRRVLALNPQVAGAYANLGVIYMRRKQWPRALAMLHKAARLAP